MKKVVLFFAGLLFVHGYSSGQSFFSLQWEVAEPTESFSDVAGTGFGVRGTYMHFVGQSFAVTGAVGYTKWGPRRDSLMNNEYKFVSIPVQLGFKLLLAKSVVAPYVGLAVGMNYLRVRGIAPNSTPDTYEETSELKFGFSPHIGTAVFVAGPIGVDLSGSYNVIYTSDNPSKYFGLNVGLAVGL